MVTNLLLLAADAAASLSESVPSPHDRVHTNTLAVALDEPPVGLRVVIADLPCR